MAWANHKRLTVTLAVLVVLLAALCGKLFWDYSLLNLRTEFARDQIEIFHDMRDKALQGAVTNATDCLRYTVDYYPSGTKQIPGSRLDRIVEHERMEAVHDIIACLRTKTAEDLGNDPVKWVEKYGSK